MSSPDPSQADVDIEEFIEAIGDQLVFQDTIENEEGMEASIRICLHGDHRYFLIDPEDTIYMEIRYDFRIAEEIGRQLSDETINDLLDDEDEDRDYEIRPGTSDTLEEHLEGEADGELVIYGDDEVEHGRPTRAAQELIRSVSPEAWARFNLDLFQELSHPDVGAKIIRNEDGTVSGFRVTRKVFPGDGGFSLTEFNNSVQSVVSVGTFGGNVTATLLPSELEVPGEG